MFSGIGGGHCSCETCEGSHIGVFQCSGSHCGFDVRDGICVDPPLCRGTSQGIYGSRTTGLVCEGETVGKIGEVDEVREILCLWSVSSAARIET